MIEIKYYWNQETIDHFQHLNNYMSRKDIIEEIENFVYNDCTIEEGETHEDLVNDLINQTL